MIHGVAAATRWRDFRQALSLFPLAGVISLNGKDATLEYDQKVFVLPSAAGSYTFSGQIATLGDPYASSNVLLINFDGVDGATTTTDQATNKAITFAGNAQIDTAQSKFGGGSLLLDGTGDYLTLADSDDFSFTSGKFTVECWVRFNSVADATFLSKWTTSATTAEWSFRYVSNSLTFYYYDTTNTLRTVAGSWTPSTNTWYHVAVDRDASNVARVYVDGAMLGKATLSQAIANRAEGLRIGALNHTTPQALNGWLDSIRVTKGVSRYESDAGYTVPTAAFSRL